MRTCAARLPPGRWAAARCSSRQAAAGLRSRFWSGGRAVPFCRSCCPALPCRQITGPLRDRFGVLLKLELYGPDELARIIMRSAGILDQPITPEGAYELAKCSRGTPRVANRFLKRIRDFATVLGDGVIDRDVALMGLKRMDVDALGLDELDRSVLRAIIEMYNGGPVGLETLAAALGEEAVTLEDLCEPYLMQMGFLTRTPRGRCVTRLAYEHLGMKAPESGAPEDNGQQSLF